MLCMTVVLEDHVVHATYDDLANVWKVALCNQPTGHEHLATWSDTELAAVLALVVVGSNVIKDEVEAVLYAIAEPLFAPPCPSECRLIP